MLIVIPNSFNFSTSPSVSFAGLSSLDFSVGIVQPKCLHTSRFNSLRSFNCSLIFIVKYLTTKIKINFQLKKYFKQNKKEKPPNDKSQMRVNQGNKGNLYSIFS